MEMYAHGLSTRDIEAVSTDAGGRSLQSRTAVSEITERLWAEYEAFASSDQVDAAIVLFLRRQRRSPSALYTRLQPRQLHADAGDAQGGGTVVAEQPTREADQDRRQGRQPWPLRHVPDGRGGGATADVLRDPDAHHPVAGAARSSMKGLWGRKAWTTMGEVRLDEGK